MFNDSSLRFSIKLECKLK